MKLSNSLFFAAALVFANPVFADEAKTEDASPESKACIMEEGGETSCQRCGDGYCAKSCENEQTCPQDCGGVDS